MAHDKAHASNKTQQSDVVLTIRYQQPKSSNKNQNLLSLIPILSES